MEIDGFVVVTLSLEVASLDDNLAVTHSFHIEEGGGEAEGQVLAASAAIQVEAALVLDDESAVTLSHEAEGHLIHLLDFILVDETDTLADGYFLERLEADKYIVFHRGGSDIIVIEVAECCVDGVGFAPSVSFEVLFAVVSDGIPLAGLNGIGSSEETACAILDGLGVGIHLSLCESAALEVCGSLGQNGGECADIAVGTPIAWIVADGHQFCHILVCRDGLCQSGGVNQHSLECLDGSLQGVVLSHIHHFVQIHSLCCGESLLDGCGCVAHLAPLGVAVNGDLVELEGGEVPIAAPRCCAVDVEADVFVGFREQETV